MPPQVVSRTLLAEEGGVLMRIVVGDVEVVVRNNPAYAWVENGRVEEHQFADLRTALELAQQELRRQR